MVRKLESYSCFLLEIKYSNKKHDFCSSLFFLLLYDVTYADGCDLLVPTYRGIRSGTANNRACQIGRTTEATGNIGGNKPQENRPPYYVVVYGCLN